MAEMGLLMVWVSDTHRITPCTTVVLAFTTRENPSSSADFDAISGAVAALLLGRYS